MAITPGQDAVLNELLRDAAGNKTIARRLGVDIETVKTQLARLYNLTGYRSREALILAVTTGRIDVVCQRTCAECRVVNGHAKWCSKGEAA